MESAPEPETQSRRVCSVVQLLPANCFFPQTLLLVHRNCGLYGGHGNVQETLRPHVVKSLPIDLVCNLTEPAVTVESPHKLTIGCTRMIVGLPALSLSLLQALPVRDGKLPFPPTAHSSLLMALKENHRTCGTGRRWFDSKLKLPTASRTRELKWYRWHGGLIIGRLRDVDGLVST